MKDTVEVFGKRFEYDFLSGWIKYNRIKNDLSQDALAYGVCSTSYLSYFENGKKRLSREIIEGLLNKMNITTIMGSDEIGLIRQNLYNMTLFIEMFDYDYATTILVELKSSEHMLLMSPYNIEYKVYELMYRSFVDRLDYSLLQSDIELLDKVYYSMNHDLKFIYMLVTGTYIGQFHNQQEGIKRLKTALNIKETAWINYRLGVLLCLSNQQLLATHYLLKALDSYEKSGQFINVLQCHSFLGMCYTALKTFDMALDHYHVLLRGTEYFDIPVNFWGVYNGLANLYLNMKDYEESIKWSKLAMKEHQNIEINQSNRWAKSVWNFDNLPVLGGAYYIEACMHLNRLEACQEIFNTYLKPQFEQSTYYKYLQYLSLLIYHFHDDIFYMTITQDILPFYEGKGYMNIVNKLKLKLCEHLECKRKYKEANLIYKELLNL